MRIFVAGASGAIGTRLVPQLVERGHEVIGSFNSPGGAERVRALGAKPVKLDLLDASAVHKSVLGARPDAIAHEATALANITFSRNFDKVFAQTNRLRTEGTDALLAAAREAGVSRFVAQSYASARYAREGDFVKTEDDALDPAPPASMRESHAAMRHLDQAVTAAGGTILRYGGFYGADNDGLIEPVRKRQFPIVGDGGGVTSFIHLDDAAAATVLALEQERPGIYHVVDDEPAPAKRVAAGDGGGAGRQAAAPLPGLAGPSVRRRGRGADGDRVARRVEREGEARAGLDAALPELARGLRGGLRRRRDGHADRGPAKGGLGCRRGGAVADQAVAGVGDRVLDRAGRPGE